MNRDITQAASRKLQNRQKNSVFKRVISGCSALVVFFTTYSLILPALTLEAATACGLEEHIHSEECWGDVTTLVCGREETEGHIHDESCVIERTEYVCGLDEDENHTHDETCVSVTREYICGQDETVPHIHDASCYITEHALVCGKEEHVHSRACYVQGDATADVETSDQWEDSVSAAELTGDIRRDVAAIAATQLGYSSSMYNYVTDDSGKIYGWSRFGAALGDPYADVSAAYVQFCLRYAGIDIGYAADAVTLADIFMLEGNFRAAGTYVPQTGDIMFTAADGIIDGAAIVTEVGEGYIHALGTNDHGTVVETLWSETDPLIAGYGVLTDDVVTVPEIIDEIPDAPETDEPMPELPEEPELPEIIDEETTAEETTESETTVEETTEAETTAEETTEAETITEETTEPEEETAADTVADEPEEPETADEIETELTDEPEIPEDDLPEDDGDIGPVFMPAQSFRRILDDMTVTVDSDAGTFPREVTMRAFPVDDDGIISAAADAVEGDVVKVVAVDISFVDESGAEIEPELPVRVTITLDEPEQHDMQVVHVEDDGTATPIDAEADTPADEVKFEAESFSVYAVVYTVDFEYDGFTYSIDGGTSITLGELTYILNITGILRGGDYDASTVAYVEFSDPELVKVYYDETAGDWVLESLIAFDTEETLIVTMGDGSVVTVRVTDAQQITSASNIAEGEYVFYVGSGGSNYAVKYDGTTENLGSSTPSASASEDIIWMLHSNGDGTWTAYSKSHPENHLNFEAEDNSTIISSSGAIVIQIYSRDTSGGFDLTNSDKDKFLSIDTANRDKFITVVSGKQSRMRIYQVSAHSVEEDTGNKFTVTVSPSTGGTVTVGDGSAATSTKADIKTGGDSKGTNDRQIRAIAKSNYVFSHWELDGVKLTSEDYSTNTIKGGALSVTEGQTLTAVFSQKDTPDTPIDSDAAQTEITRWLTELLGNSVSANKTAAVSGEDYANRIYKVTLDAASGARVMEQSVSLTFLVDTSRSMLFPADLENDTTYDKKKLKTWLDTNDPNGASGKTYYIIADETNTATMYAVYYRDGAWRYMDASYYYDSFSASISSREGTVTDNSYGTVDGKSGGRGLSGHIYTAPDKVEGKPWTRLDYIKLALKAAGEAIAKLDPEPNIGLVTFNKAATYIGTYGASQYTSFQNAVDNDIALDGGTRQDLGLAKVIEKRSTLFPAGNGRRNVTLLITDGAPQIAIPGQQNKYYDNDTAWGSSYIGGQVDLLTNTYGIELFTLGLSLDKVGVNEAKLNGVATGGHHWGANESSAYVTAIEEIAEEMMEDVTLFGTVTDTVDPAFYPVKQDGTPIDPGYYNMDGDYLGNSQPGVNTPYYKWENNGETWKITWENQDIKWLKNGGWEKAFYMKAKENFLGGNAISTNLSASVSATKYRDSNSNVKNLGRTVSQELNTPHVNVDELALTSANTEWTVFLGTEVNPKEQLEKLLRNIDIRKVVSGDTNEMIKSKDQMLNGTSESSKTIKLTDYLGLDTDEKINELITELLSSRSKTYQYNSSTMTTAYGHGYVGDIVISLESTSGCYNKDNHATEEVGKDTEFTLKVEYIPKDHATRNTELGITNDDYHTTSGGSAGDLTGTMTSTNTHKINVFAKKLKIEKIDQTKSTITSDTATFVLYRKATEEESKDDSVTKVNNPSGLLAGDYVVVQTLTTSGGSVTTDTLPLLPNDEPYYLIETKAPAGYNMLTEPLKVTIDMEGHNTWTKLSNNSTSQEKPNPYELSNWLQEATIKVTDIEGKETSSAIRVYKVNEKAEKDGKKEYTITYDHTNDTTDASVTYKIINNSGIELPSTGSTGTLPYYFLGITLIALAAVYPAVRRRVDRE